MFQYIILKAVNSSTMFGEDINHRLTSKNAIKYIKLFIFDKNKIKKKTGMYIILNYLVLKKSNKLINCLNYSNKCRQLHFDGVFVYDHVECKYVS